MVAEIRAGLLAVMKAASALDAADPSRLQAGRAGVINVAYDLISANPEMKQAQLVAQVFQAAESLTGLLKTPSAGSSTAAGAMVMVTGTDGILREKTTCHSCGMLGHYAKVCPTHPSSSGPGAGRRYGTGYGGSGYRAQGGHGYGGGKSGHQAEHYASHAQALALPPPIPN